jgi:hypothetical protein
VIYSELHQYGTNDNAQRRDGNQPERCDEGAPVWLGEVKRPAQDT